MKTIQKIWIKFAAQPNVWFFYGLLFIFTLSIRKVLFFYPIQNQFNEYSGVYLYLSDIFLILTILSTIIILYNNKSLLSISSYCDVPRGTLLLPAILIVWSFTSIFWSNNTTIALFRSTKLLEFYFLYLFIIIIVPRETILKNLFKILISIGLIDSIIGIWQFTIQHSAGLFYLKESSIGSEINGVAKLIFSGEKIIRAYGLFPHPNILGGFLLISLIISLTYTKLFHVEQKVTAKLKIIIFIQIIALILTFSKSAIIGLLISLLYIYLTHFVPRGTKFAHIKFKLSKLYKNVSRGTINIRRYILISLIFLISAYFIHPTTSSFLFNSIDQRLIYLNVSRGTIVANPIFGVGMGQFVLNMQAYTNQTLSSWQFQPVHNVFLLIWSELGLIGLLLFVWMLWKLFHVEQTKSNLDIKCSTWNKNHCEVYEPSKLVPRLSAEEDGTFIDRAFMLVVFRGILLGFIFIMLFDHYLWDIQQGQIMLWLVLAIITGLQNTNIDI